MISRHIKLSVLALFLFSGLVSAAKTAQKEKGILSVFFKDAPAYLYGYSTADGSDGLHLLYSYDGLAWRTLNNGEALMKSTVSKTLQDPSIVQDSEGCFHMVFSTGSKNSIGYASSKDLIHWTDQKELPVMADEPLVQSTTAPEILFDKLSKTFHLVWASSTSGKSETGKTEEGLKNQLYGLATSDFKTFTKRTPLLNADYSVNECSILKQKGAYRLFYKNEVDNTIEWINAERLKTISKINKTTISGNKPAAGPAALQVEDYTYIYWENYMDKTMAAKRCKNINKPVWENISDMIRFPAGVKRGVAIKINKGMLAKLQNLEKVVE